MVINSNDLLKVLESFILYVSKCSLICISKRSNSGRSYISIFDSLRMLKSLYNYQLSYIKRYSDLAGCHFIETFTLVSSILIYIFHKVCWLFVIHVRINLWLNICRIDSCLHFHDVATCSLFIFCSLVIGLDHNIFVIKFNFHWACIEFFFLW